MHTYLHEKGVYSRYIFSNKLLMVSVQGVRKKKKSGLPKIQAFQLKNYRRITNAFYYVANKTLHSD